VIQFSRKKLSNGLTVLVHEDFTTPMVAVNLLYQVGSKHDPTDRTGLAHLLEHMMFTGSLNAKDFDTPLQLASGENNAFTNKDITNYYEILPVGNIKTALWLESDRMKDLLFDQAAFDTQQSVVVEEYKETCLNPPYGMVWHHLMALAYKHHPYRWPTIGLNEEHIRAISIDNLQDYYQQYYSANNAILSIGGKLSANEAFDLAEEWFGDISPAVGNGLVKYPHEPAQDGFRYDVMTVNASVNMIYLAFHMPNREDMAFYAADFITDILGNGKSSRLYQNLVKEQTLFISIDAYITGNTDPGLLIIEGKLSDGATHDIAQKAIWNELDQMINEPISDHEATKIYNQMISSVAFGNISLLNNMMNLGYYEYLGDADLINTEPKIYGTITPAHIQSVAAKILHKDNCSQLDVKASETSNQR